MTYPVHLVGDVAKHDGGANIGAVQDTVTRDTVVLISWVWVLLVLVLEGATGSTKANNASLRVNRRVVAMRRGGRTVTVVQLGVDSDPLVHMLSQGQQAYGRKNEMTYILLDTPDGISSQAVDSTTSRIDGVELDAVCE